MVRLHPTIVATLAKRLESGETGSIMLTLGISANTWAKLRKGEAIRASVANRLLDRIASQANMTDVRNSLSA